jgi:hypothetical protein
MSSSIYSSDKNFSKIGFVGLHKIYGSTKLSIESKNSFSGKFY